MPREIITGHPGDPTAVKVGWSRQQDAQIGIVPIDDTDDSSLALWCDLDRKQINDLISLLRKARDAAYGRDQ